MKLPNPLDQMPDRSFHQQPLRILSDRGIRQALAQELITITPPLSEADTTRIQPATLDVKIQEVEEAEPLPFSIDGFEFIQSEERTTLRPRSVSTVMLTELINFGQLNHGLNILEPVYFGVRSEARSSLRRFGIYMANGGNYFFSGPQYSQLEVGNFGCNPLHLRPGDRFAQLFFTVNVFADYHFTEVHELEHAARALPRGEQVRALDMGVEVLNHRQLRLLQRQSFMNIPDLKCYKGMITVHASSTAYRMKRIAGGIHFHQRDQYHKEELLEPIDISRGYTIKPFEHIMVETQEKLELSDHVGIFFWDNILSASSQANHMNMPQKCFLNTPLISLPDGWVDPGYNGIFSRQPKWLTGRTIYPGEVIGFGQVFFFPNGVEKPYGQQGLGSQYHNTDSIKFAR